MIKVCSYMRCLFHKVGLQLKLYYQKFSRKLKKIHLFMMTFCIDRNSSCTIGFRYSILLFNSEDIIKIFHFIYGPK